MIKPTGKGDSKLSGNSQYEAVKHGATLVRAIEVAPDDDPSEIRQEIADIVLEAPLNIV